MRVVPCAKAKMGAVNSLDRRKPNQTEPKMVIIPSTPKISKKETLSGFLSCFS